MEIHHVTESRNLGVAVDGEKKPLVNAFWLQVTEILAQTDLNNKEIYWIIEVGLKLAYS